MGWVGSILESSPGLWAGITGPSSAILLVVPGVPVLVPIVLAGIAYGLSVLELDLPRTVGGRPDQGENRRVALWAGTVSISGAAIITVMVIGIEKPSSNWILLGVLLAFGQLLGYQWFQDLEPREEYRVALEGRDRVRYSQSVKAAGLFSLAMGAGLGDLLALWGAVAGVSAGAVALARIPEDLTSLRRAVDRLRHIGGAMERRLWKEVRQAGEYPGSLYPLLVANISLLHLSFFLPFTNLGRAGLVQLLPTILLIGVVSLTLLVVALNLQHWAWSVAPAIVAYVSILVLAIRYGEALPLAQTLIQAMETSGSGPLSHEELQRILARRASILVTIYYLVFLIVSLPTHFVEVADWQRNPEKKLQRLKWKLGADVTGTIVFWVTLPLLLVPPVVRYIEPAFPILAASVKYQFILRSVFLSFLGASIITGILFLDYIRSRKEVFSEYDESIGTDGSEQQE